MEKLDCPQEENTVHLTTGLGASNDIVSDGLLGLVALQKLDCAVFVRKSTLNLVTV